MELAYLVRLLEHNKFERTNLPLSSPLVVHGIAGSGKSTILTTFHHHYPAHPIFSHSPTLLDPSNRIYQQCITTDSVPDGAIVDEYNYKALDYSHCLALFGDPLQLPHSLQPHYYSSRTHRYGPKLTSLLNNLFHLSITSLAPVDSLDYADPFAVDPSGFTIADEEVYNFVSQQVPGTLLPLDTVGLEYSSVSFYCSDLRRCVVLRPLSTFIALTRAKGNLTIFDFNARFSSTT
nr:triple gene block 1 [Cymbidium mosaic virus]